MDQFGTAESYLKACDKISKNGFDVRLYQSAELAMYDVVHSLIHFMPHKSKVAVVSLGSHLVEIVTSLSLKNQNQIITKKPNENIITFLETLDSNTHFVYWATEHEVTGEVIYSEKQCEEILSVINRKKIFSIQLTHHAYTPKNYSSETVSYSVLIQVPNIFKTQSEISMVYFSEKQKIPFGIAQLQDISFLNKNWPSGHVRDRVIVELKDSSALAVKEYLKLKNQEAFVVAEYPSWITDKWMTWWPELTQPKRMQNFLVLSSEYTASHPNYADQISQAESDIKAQSTFKV